MSATASWKAFAFVALCIALSIALYPLVLSLGVADPMVVLLLNVATAVASLFAVVRNDVFVRFRTVIGAACVLAIAIMAVSTPGGGFAVAGQATVFAVSFAIYWFCAGRANARTPQ